MTMKAMCFTKAATTMRGYFNQQLRWKRSNIVDFIVGIGHAWKLHPLLCLQYLSMLLLLLVYPFVIITNVQRGDFFELAMFHVLMIGGFSARLLLRAERARAAAVAARAPDRVPADGRADAGRVPAAHAARAVHARQLELGDARPRRRSGRPAPPPRGAPR